MTTPQVHQTPAFQALVAHIQQHYPKAARVSPETVARTIETPTYTPPPLEGRTQVKTPPTIITPPQTLTREKKATNTSITYAAYQAGNYKLMHELVNKGFGVADHALSRAFVRERHHHHSIDPITPKFEALTLLKNKGVLTHTKFWSNLFEVAIPVLAGLLMAALLLKGLDSLIPLSLLVNHWQHALAIMLFFCPQTLLLCMMSGGVIGLAGLLARDAAMKR